ncbi:surA N-terminal domain protein, partial [Vibrio parahaemolyticus 861]
YAARPRS